jgi:hypothetical protein
MRLAGGPAFTESWRFLRGVGDGVLGGDSEPVIASAARYETKLLRTQVTSAMASLSSESSDGS